MDPMLIALLALAAIGALGAVIAFNVLRTPLRDLMTRTVGIDAATAFYERALFLGLVYIAVAAVFGAGMSVEKDPTFMSYVWMVGDEVDEVLGWLAGFLALYLALMTVVVATHRRRD